MPLGLIVNEAVTNAIKYALSTSNHGHINIRLTPLGERQFELSITDSGPGFPADFNAQSSSSLGVMLMQGLAQQLEGSVHFGASAQPEQEGAGANVRIVFLSTKPSP